MLKKLLDALARPFRVDAPAVDASLRNDAAIVIGIAAAAIAPFLASLSPYPRSTFGAWWLYLALWVRMLAVLWALSPSRRDATPLSTLFTSGLLAGLTLALVDGLLMAVARNGRLQFLTVHQAAVFGVPFWRPLLWAFAFVEAGYLAVRARALVPERYKPAAAAFVPLAYALVAWLPMELLAARSGWWNTGPSVVRFNAGTAAYLPMGTLAGFVWLWPSIVQSLDDRGGEGRLWAGLRWAACIAAGIGFFYLALEWRRMPVF